MSNVKIFEPSSIVNKDNIEFGEYILIDDFVKVHAKSKITIGNYVHIGSYSSLVASGASIVMKDFSGLSYGVRIVTSSDDFKSDGFGNPTIAEEFRNVSSGNVTIEKFAIVGTNSVILPGVTVGEGSTVAAGSIVSRDLEPWGIYIGNRRVGDRPKEGVLSRYENFKATEHSLRIGNIFK